jgi:hypothetical protein
MEARLGEKKGVDTYGHWWLETGRTSGGKWEPVHSYGWWPEGSVGLKQTFKIKRVEGVLNRGKGDDPHHGDTADREHHPAVEVPDGESYESTRDRIEGQVSSFAKAFKGSWNWRLRWGKNCHTFVERAEKQLGLRQDPKAPLLQGGGAKVPALLYRDASTIVDMVKIRLGGEDPDAANLDLFLHSMVNDGFGPHQLRLLTDAEAAKLVADFGLPAALLESKLAEVTGQDTTGTFVRAGNGAGAAGVAARPAASAAPASGADDEPLYAGGGLDDASDGGGADAAPATPPAAAPQAAAGGPAQRPATPPPAPVSSPEPHYITPDHVRPSQAGQARSASDDAEHYNAHGDLGDIPAGADDQQLTRAPASREELIALARARVPQASPIDFKLVMLDWAVPTTRYPGVDPQIRIMVAQVARLGQALGPESISMLTAHERADLLSRRLDVGEAKRRADARAALYALRLEIARLEHQAMREENAPQIREAHATMLAGQH